MDKVKADVLAKWTPDKVQDACGVDETTMYRVAKMMHDNRPGTLVWCMGQTQHSIGNAMVRASCIVQLALGNVGKSRSQEHTSELQSLMRISYAVFCLNKKHYPCTANDGNTSTLDRNP